MSLDAHKAVHLELLATARPPTEHRVAEEEAKAQGTPPPGSKVTEPRPESTLPSCFPARQGPADARTGKKPWGVTCATGQEGPQGWHLETLASQCWDGPVRRNRPCLEPKTLLRPVAPTLSWGSGSIYLGRIPFLPLSSRIPWVAHLTFLQTVASSYLQAGQYLRCLTHRTVVTTMRKFTPST